VAEPGSHTKLSKRKLAKYLKQKDFAGLVSHADRIAAALGMMTTLDAFNPVVTDFYEQVGYLPEAIVNYLCLLGWSLDDRTDHLTVEQMVENFTLERVNKSPASFDSGKLMAFQERHMRLLSLERKLTMVIPFLIRAGIVQAAAGKDVDDGTKEKTRKILVAAGDRIRTAGDILDYTDFFTTTELLNYDEKSLEKVQKNATAETLLAGFVPQLAAIDDTGFTAAETDPLVHRFAESEECKIGDLILALRVALTGKGVGFGLFETFEILGKTESLARIDRFAEKLKKAC
jgi:Glutamyl- and glutaminyl-tRNA synthetases